MDGQLRFFQMDGIACGNWNRIYQTKEYADRFHFISFHSSFLGFSQKPSSFLFFSLLLQPWARVQVSSPTSARKRKALFSSILFSTFFFSLSLTIFLMLFLYHLLFFSIVFQICWRRTTATIRNLLSPLTAILEWWDIDWFFFPLQISISFDLLPLISFLEEEQLMISCGDVLRFWLFFIFFVRSVCFVELIWVDSWMCCSLSCVLGFGLVSG